MRLPQCPNTTAELDLAKRLSAYGNGTASWLSDRIGSTEVAACAVLYANVVAFVDNVVQPLLNRANAREMSGFTMHDKKHGLKVAHLMWHIIEPRRRELLTPVEIALLLLSAHMHDLGMSLSEDERKTRLAPDSDLWDSIDPKSPYLLALEELTKRVGDPATSLAAKAEALGQIYQAQESLLCNDTRDRHATRSRYKEIISLLDRMSGEDEIKIPNVHSTCSFDGDSFERKLIEICVSHNEGPEVLLQRDESNPDQWRFPTVYSVGSCVADTRFVAAALRLADILDFDRERTPPVLFHYLLPRSGDPSSNVSVREWSKHLAISNWEIDSGKLVYRGRSNNVVTHHAVVEFSKAIEQEINRTREILSDAHDWPFVLSSQVSLLLETEGYRYIPYRFSLDEERIYRLLMGSNIYKDRLDAIRELIQNAVDSCRFRDALLIASDPSVTPSVRDRIVVRYEEPREGRLHPTISVIDTGTGMDRWLIENFFLKVGRSFYSSMDFLRVMAGLRKVKADFAPVAEFGIGFLSCFMLSDRVDVRTAHWLSPHQDTTKRHLKIDGVGRLIEVSESPNDGPGRFVGTSIALTLSKIDSGYEAPTWSEVQQYINHTCINLPYPLTMQHVDDDGEVTDSVLLPSGLTVRIPEHLSDVAVRIPVDTPEMVGEIVLYRESEERDAEEKLTSSERVNTSEATGRDQPLLRGGFRVGRLPGLPSLVLGRACDAQVEVRAQGVRSRSRVLPATDLARAVLEDRHRLAGAIFRHWLGYILQNVADFEERPLGDYEVEGASLEKADWLEDYSALEIYRVARIFWESNFSDNWNFKKKIARWEKSEGSYIPLNRWSSAVSRRLLTLILPSVCDLIVLREGSRGILPPRQGWRAELSACRSFISAPANWGHFAKYEDAIADVVIDLYASQTTYFNSKFESRFESFNTDDLLKLAPIFETAVQARSWKRRAVLSSQNADLLRRAIEAAGDLYVGRLGENIRISELA